MKKTFLIFHLNIFFKFSIETYIWQKYIWIKMCFLKNILNMFPLYMRETKQYFPKNIYIYIF